MPDDLGNPLSLEEFLELAGPPRFNPRPWHNEHGDSIQFVSAPEAYVARWVERGFTVYDSMVDGRVVGFQITLMRLRNPSGSYDMACKYIWSLWPFLQIPLRLSNKIETWYGRNHEMARSLRKAVHRFLSQIVGHI